MISRRLVFTLAVTLITVTVTPVCASPAVATRTLPASVESGTAFDVTIEASGCGIFGQVVETLPDGFSYIGCPSCTTDDIGVSQAGNTVKFGFLGDSTSFTYRVKAPNVAAPTTYAFHGIVKDEDKNEYPIEDDDITVKVSGPPTDIYTLTMVVDGNGSTTPSVGRHYYDAGDVVQICAAADCGWKFDGWDGDVARPPSPCTTITMHADKIIIANFAEISSEVCTLTATCQPSDGGNIILSPVAVSNQYEVDSSVELTATPSQGYVFTSWSGDISGTANPISTTMDSNKNVTANFVLLPALKRPASFSVSHLNISPGQAKPDQQVDISITITNNGEKTGSYEAVLYIDEQIEGSQTASISPGSSQNVVFGVTKAVPGTYIVSLAGQEGQFVVVDSQFTTTDSQSSNGWPDNGTTVVIVVIAALIAAIAFVLRKIKKRA